MKIFVLGNQGRMGTFLTDFLGKKGFSVNGSDITGDKAQGNEDEMRDSDVLILAVPQDEALKFVIEHEDFSNMVEIGSVKSIFRKFADKIVSIHPLFGPLSEDSEPRNPHFHQQGAIISFFSTPRAVCPECAREWKETGYRSEIKRLKALLRTENSINENR
ncbi:prephenate dehydrogenase [mine drainage metagenome]|uniref:Prephenate dehydrogenase n=1 Tax=mine drainage metagenome TaxID=410659 RepID=T1CIE6_9ZZZZ